MRSTVGCGVVRFLILAGWVIAGPIVHAQLRTQTRSDEAPTNDPLPDDLGEFLRKFPFLDFGADEDFSVIARMTKGEFEFRPTAGTWQVVRPPLGPSGAQRVPERIVLVDGIHAAIRGIDKSNHVPIAVISGIV